MTPNSHFAEHERLRARCFHPTGVFLPIPDDEVDQSLLPRFDAMVARFPDALAVNEGGRSLTYRQLDAAANQVANALLAAHGPDACAVALLFGMELEWIIATLGVWKAGKFWVALDLRHPATRHAAIVEDAQAPLILTTARHHAAAHALAGEMRQVVLVEDALAHASAKVPQVEVSPTSYAYLVYTSGSTGRPKGVIENHTNILHMIAERGGLVHPSNADRIALLLPPAAGGAIYNIVLALWYGAALMLFEFTEEGLKRFEDWLVAAGITGMHAGVVLRTWLPTLDGSRRFPSLRFLLLGAAPVYREHVEAFQRHLGGDCLLINPYSSAEVRAVSLFAMDHATALDSQIVPVGFPPPWVTVEIWDEAGQRLPPGATGEVMIFTPYMTPGYWQQPELTAQVFGTDAQGRRYYRSGDVGRLDADGCLWVLGRKDRQVKIRGHRVEPAEVEVALLNIASVREAAVVVHGTRDDAKYLMAYLTLYGTQDGGRTQDEERIRREIANRLPYYMVPRQVTVLEKLPRNHYGKVDRPHLAAHGSQGVAPVATPPSIPAQAPAPTQVAVSAQQAFSARVAEGAAKYAAGGDYVQISPSEVALTAVHRWERMVAEFGTNLALAWEDGEAVQQRLSYVEVNALANQLAHALLRHDLPRDLPIALLLDVEWGLPVGLLATWKAGHFFMWIESRQPLARNEFIVQEAGARVVVTSRQHEEMARQLFPAPGAVIVLDALAEGLPSHNPPITVTGEQIAYIVYTSGSTGQAKGTIELHRNLVHFVAARQEIFHYSAQDRHSILLFGVGAITPIVGAWLYGGSLWPFQTKYEGLVRFSRWLVENRLTMVNGGADLRTWLMSLDGSEQFPDLRWLIVSAGPSYREHIEAYQRYLHEGCTLVNLYSATEFRTSVIALFDKHWRVAGRLMPSGYIPTPGTVEIWDEEDRPRANGESGEVIIVSEYVAAGYWQSPQLSAEKFGTDAQGRRYYRTGDLGRLDQDGCLWVLGRMDGQFKIRGNRVESAEVEDALRALPHVQEAAVIHQGETDEDRVLVGFVAATPDTVGRLTGEVAGSELRKQLAAHLPDYMIPTKIHVLDELPRNANGKVHRPALRLLLTRDDVAHPIDHPPTRQGYFHPTGEYVPITPAEMELTLLHRWERMVARFGDRHAIEEAERTLTYADVNVLANRIAHAILARQLPKDQPVAFMVDIEGDLAINILSIWKAGHPFVWFAPSQPLARNQYMVEDCGAQLVITNRQHADAAYQLWPAEAVIVIDDVAADLPTHNPPITIAGDDIAYIMYTSGSTGKPKGAMDVHRNGVMMVATLQEIFHYSPHDRTAIMVLGNGCVYGMNLALMYGGCLLPFNTKEQGLARLSRWLIERRVTVAVGGAILRPWLAALDGSEQFPDLRYLTVGAGPMYIEHVQAFQRYLADRCVMAHMFSATEFHLGALLPIDKQTRIETRAVSVGLPTQHVTLEIWNEAGQPLPAGESGEIIIISPFLAHGYWRSPELTAQRFGTDAQGRRYYHTGDLGRVDAQGQLWVLGRKDGQVKIRGNRVETAEVEMALRELPDVVEAAVVDHTPQHGAQDEDRVLLGFVSARTQLSGASLRKQLAVLLPDYMVPATILVMDELPRNAAGKVDRPALRAMTLNQGSHDEGITQVAKMTAEIAKVVAPQVARLPAAAQMSAAARAQQQAVMARGEHPTGEHIPITLEEIELTPLHRFERIVARFGNHPAVQEGDRRLTYSELNQEINRLAHALLPYQVPKDVPVALLYDVETDLPISIFAIWKVGNFFVWLEPQQPVARNQFVVEDSGATLIVTNRKHADMARQLFAPERVVVVDEVAHDLPTHNPPITVVADDPAYLIYTSGSTGRPKGTVDLLRNLVAMCVARQAYLHFSDQDRLNWMVLASGWSFAVLGSWFYGGCLMPYRPKEEGLARFSQWLIDERITMSVGGAVMRAWLLTLDGSQQFPHLRAVTVGAAPTYREHVEAYQRYLADSCILLNTYSATEVRSVAIYGVNKQTRLATRVLPAGYPTLHGAIEIWDEQDRPLPVGELGEIVAITPYTAREYWKLPAVTAQRFGTDAQGHRYYRTGDLGRIDPEGCLWVLGRKDNQVKIRGNRVETAEVEVALLELAGVNEATVIDIGDTDETRILLGFVTGNGELVGRELRKQLALRLPDFMVPSMVIVLEELPRNAAGKVARPLLREMATAFSANLRESYTPHANAQPDTAAAPLTEMQQRVTAIVSELLNGNPIGLHDNFFDNGGHSLLAARLMLTIHRRFGVDLAPRDFFSEPTVAALAASVERELALRAQPTAGNLPVEREKASAFEVVSVLVGVPDHIPVFLCIGRNGSLDILMSYQELLRRLGKQRSLYGLVANGGDDPDAIYATMDELVESALAAMRRVQPHGPYLLVGECIGGKLAYEMARKLTQLGETVASLTLIDTSSTPYNVKRPFALSVWKQTQRLTSKWYGRLIYHTRQMVGLGLKDGTNYFVERLGAVMPATMHTQSRYRPQYLAHKRYFDLLTQFDPRESYRQGGLAIFSREYAHNAEKWATLIPGLQIILVDGTHNDYLAVSGEDVAAHIRKVLELAPLKKAK